MLIIRRTIQAQADIKEILDDLDEKSPEAANRFAMTLKQKTEGLARMPEMGRSREELAPGLRSFGAENYLIFYRPIEKGILVVRVAHGARHLPSLFEE